MTNIFLFAHQDDEFGVFAEIARLLALKQNVIIVYLTSGNPYGTINGLRNRESVRVLSKLGVSTANIHFIGEKYGIPDGKLVGFMDLAYQKLNELLGNYPQISSFYYLAWEGGHQDHDAVHILGTVLGNKYNILNNCIQFSLYHGKSLPYIFFKVLSPILENGPVNFYKMTFNERLKYISYCFYYKSQRKTWMGLFPFLLYHYSISGTQELQNVSLERIQKRPHPGKLLYEKRGFYTYEKFVENRDKFLADKLV
ncbi:MAG TPA: PIG-L family deacetylase [Aquella sp.]|nr:PIG-L family deacetylase [Aquella sp.]